MAVSVEIRGAREAQRAADRTIKALTGEPIIQGMRQAVLLVIRTARQEAKVDSGRYRSSITGDVRTIATRVEGVVGSNVVHAPWAVLDTRPHWPPRTPELERWARRHGIPVFLVQRAIARHGTKGDQSLFLGIEQNADRIFRLLQDATAKACDTWEK